MKEKLISRNVWILSLVSLFTDMASEMLYPVMPLYLKEIGFTMIGIGILEGFAEAIAGLSKGYFGVWSDNTGKRTIFVRTGYALSAISKPMMALFSFPAWIFFARTIDRLGKGLRTGARDALLSDEATKETKASVFGFHRSMDTVGAMLGPALALAFLYYFPNQYKSLFLLALIPGLLAIAATFIIKEKRKQQNKGKQYPSFKAFYTYWNNSSKNYRTLAGALLFFSLINSSDVFLLLKMKEKGIDDTVLIGIYIFYNAVYAFFAFPLGKLADKIGFRKVVFTGFIFFALAYFIIAHASSIIIFISGFFIYALYAAATEGIAKGWISNIVPANETASAIGTFTGFQSIAALLASSLTGMLWFSIGAELTLSLSACLSAVTGFFILWKMRDS